MVLPATGLLVVCSLLLNLLLVGWLWHTQATQNSRLSRLEALAGNQGRASNAANRPRQASRQERIAFLLAAMGNPEESRRVLSAAPIEENVEIARALIAQPAANDRNEALDATLRFLAADDPARAVGLLAGTEESGLKTRLARHVVAVWITANPEDAARWLTDGGNQFFDARQISDQLASALARWSAFAPEAAARFVDTRPADGDQQPTPIALALGEACLEWGRRDAAAALAWVQSLPATDPRQPYAMAGVLQGWTEQDPVAASRFVRQALFAGAGPGGGAMAVVIVQAWTAKDPEAAARWATTLPDPAVRQLAMREAVGRWAQSDAAGAARWASGLPADRAREGVWASLSGRLAETDPARLETWLQGLPAGRDRDEATAIYINRLAPADPEKALTWTRTLAAPAFALEQVRNVLAQWEVKDTSAARNWAAANGVLLPQVSGGR